MLVYAVLALGCRLGVGPARDAISWLTGDRNYFCAPGHHHHGKRVYAVVATGGEARSSMRRRYLRPSPDELPPEPPLPPTPPRARAPPV